jgi:hypothetical protein
MQPQNRREAGFLRYIEELCRVLRQIARFHGYNGEV